MNKVHSQVEKRRLKFSQEARDAILQDPLRDVSLLSRCNAAGVQELQSSQLARESLLEQLRSQENLELLEHGLRKLREVIVSVFDEQESNRNFLELVHETYEMSYNLFMRQGQFYKLGVIVLSFMATKFPQSLYRQLYALHASHVANDLNKCINILVGNPPSYILPESQRRLILLSSIYVERVDSPARWFEILVSLPARQRELLTAAPAFCTMQERCFQYVQKCYNQISVNFLLNHWFYNTASKADIPTEWQVEGPDTQTLMLRQQRKK